MKRAAKNRVASVPTPSPDTDNRPDHESGQEDSVSGAGVEVTTAGVVQGATIGAVTLSRRGIRVALTNDEILQAIVDNAPKAAAASPGADPVDTPTLFRPRAAPAPEAPAVEPVDFLIKMGLGELLELRARIDALLPSTDLSDINLESELVMQYHLAKAMMTDASTNVAVPANQKAQVLNSCAAVLKTLAEAQTSLYDAERVKAIEGAIEKAFKHESSDVRRAFYERYGLLVREAASQKDAKKQRFAPINSKIGPNG